MSKLSGLGGRLYRGETSIEIIGHRRRWYAVSALFVLLSLGALSVQGLHLGIEFKGGSSFTVTKAGGSVEDARAAVDAAGVPGERPRRLHLRLRGARGPHPRAGTLGRPDGPGAGGPKKSLGALPAKERRELVKALKVFP